MRRESPADQRPGIFFRKINFVIAFLLALGVGTVAGEKVQGTGYKEQGASIIVLPYHRIMDWFLW